MDQERQPTCLKLFYPPPEFWRALLAYRNHAIAGGFDPYFAEPGLRHEGSVRHAADVVDNYLDIAINEGWLDN